MPAELLRYMVEKGSITVDGVEPHRRRRRSTTASPSPSSPTPPRSPPSAPRARATTVNLEVDVIAKYAERLLEGQLAALAGSARPAPSPAPSEEAR